MPSLDTPTPADPQPTSAPTKTHIYPAVIENRSQQLCHHHPHQAPLPLPRRMQSLRAGILGGGLRKDGESVGVVSLGPEVRGLVGGLYVRGFDLRLVDWNLKFLGRRSDISLSYNEWVENLSVYSCGVFEIEGCWDERLRSLFVVGYI